MKKEIIILMFIGILTSCSKDGDNPINNDLNGKWNLISVSCLCEPINLNIGEHIWTFDISNNNLLVENNVTVQLHTLLESGNYEIKVNDNKVTIISVEYDYYFIDGKLYLADDPEVDGPIIEFVRDN